MEIQLIFFINIALINFHPRIILVDKLQPSTMLGPVFHGSKGCNLSFQKTPKILKGLS